MGVGIFYENNSSSIPILQQQDLGTLEYDLSSFIIKLTEPRPRVIAFLDGHGEHMIGSGFSGGQQAPGVDYQGASEALRKNYEVKTVDFSLNQTLEGVDVLVVAGARRDLTDRDIFEIDQFLLAGGNAVFLVDGVDSEGGGVNVQPLDNNLLSLLQALGLSVDSILLLDTLSELTNFNEGPGRFFFLQYPPFIRLVADNFSQHPIVAKLQAFVVRFISGITVVEQSGLTYDEFARTSPSAWWQESPFSVNPTSIPPAQPEMRGARTVGVAVTGMFPRLSTVENIPALQQWRINTESGEYDLEFIRDDQHRKDREILTEARAEANLVLFSDSDFISDPYLQADQAGLVAFLNMVDFMTFGEELINIRSKALGGAEIGALENSEKSLMKFLGILLIPILFSGYGIFRLWARRKEEKLLKI